MIQARLQLYDCVKKGWVLDGFPETREQALALQAVGITAKHYGEYAYKEAYVVLHPIMYYVLI